VLIAVFRRIRACETVRIDQNIDNMWIILEVKSKCKQNMNIRKGKAT